MSGVMRRKRKLRSSDNRVADQAGEESVDKDASFGNANLSNNPDEEFQRHRQNGPVEIQVKEAGSQHKIREEEDTMVDQSLDGPLPKPYEFLIYTDPPLHTIIIPHFKIKSINFVLSIITIVCFLVLVAFSETRPIQNHKTWNCSLYYLQNKYYPKLRYDYEVWRVLVSPFFHSNIAHFFLNLLSLQIYGYFIEWYYGKLKYCITTITAVILAYFLSCAAQPTTISTTSSAILYSLLALKLMFFYEYRRYKPLEARRFFLWVLFFLVMVINIIPAIVNNNVDFTTLIAGFVTGSLMAIFYHLHRSETELSIGYKIAKFGVLVLLSSALIICIVLSFTLEDTNDNYKYMNETIVKTCEKA